MARIIDFSDGFQSSSSPFSGTIGVNNLSSFVNDAAFETDKGSAGSAGDIYFNTTENRIRFHNGTSWIAALDEAAKEFCVDEFTLSAGDITAKQVTLSSTPQDETTSYMLVDGGTSQHYGSAFTISGTTVDWTGLELDGLLEAGDRIFIAYNR